MVGFTSSKRRVVWIIIDIGLITSSVSLWSHVYDRIRAINLRPQKRTVKQLHLEHFEIMLSIMMNHVTEKNVDFFVKNELIKLVGFRVNLWYHFCLITFSIYKIYEYCIAYRPITVVDILCRRFFLLLFTSIQKYDYIL